MRRVAITGLGVSTPIGNTVKEFTDNLFKGHCAISNFDIFDASKYRIQLGATVKNIDNLVLPSERKLPRPIKFVIQATRNALRDSGVLSFIEPERIGSYLAGPACAVSETENFYKDYLEKGIEATSLFDLSYSTWDSAVNELGNKFKLYGPRSTMLTACSSSGLAIGLSFDLIRLGIVDAMVAGGTDGFSELTYSGFHSLQNISPIPCAPFDKNRSGLSFGEGAGVIILEDMDLAKKRGAKILGELKGYGAIGEGYNLTAPHPDAIGYKKTMSNALKMSKVNAEEVEHVNAHGTATEINDVIEASAIRSVFHKSTMRVNSIKSMIGHCMGASGAIEAVSTVISLVHQVLPGTVNFKDPDPQIDVLVTNQTCEFPMKYAICNSSGFGGNNSSLLFERPA